MIERTWTERVEILDAALRTEMREGHEALREEMVALNEKTQTLMHVLDEDVIARIALIQEGRRSACNKP